MLMGVYFLGEKKEIVRVTQDNGTTSSIVTKAPQVKSLYVFDLDTDSGLRDFKLFTQSKSEDNIMIIPVTNF